MLTKIRNKTLKVGILFLVVAALVLGMALPAMADNGKPQPSNVPNNAFQMIQGKVVQNGSASFVVQVGNQSQVGISVTNDTRYFLVSAGKAQNYVNDQVGKNNKMEKLPPGIQKKMLDLKQARIPAQWKNDLGWLAGFNKQAQFSDIEVGDRVIVRATKAATPVALQVLIIKAPVIQQVKGTISNVTSNPNSFTITPTNGTAVILSWDASTRFVLKGLISVQNGQYATAVYNRKTMMAQLVNVLPVAPN